MDALLHSPPHQWPNSVLAPWWLPSGFAFALVYWLVRLFLRQQLRAIFRRGLTGA
jgi:hypothetical protein